MALPRFPSGSSLALVPSDLHAKKSQPSAHMGASRTSNFNGFPFGSVHPPEGVPVFPDACAREAAAEANWAGSSAPPKLRSQSSVLQVSQSMRWTRGGVVLERHVASTRVVASAARNNAERWEWSGLLESQVHRGFGSGESERCGVSAPSWNAAAAAQQQHQQDFQVARPPQPLACPPAAPNSRAASTCAFPDSPSQPLSFLRRVEVFEGGAPPPSSLGPPSPQQKREPPGSGAHDGASHRPPPLAALQQGEEAASEVEVEAAAASRPSSPSACVLVSRQQQRGWPASGSVQTAQEAEQPLRGVSAADVFRASLSRTAASSKGSRAKAEGGAGRQRQTSASVVRHRSAALPADLSAVRTVKGPLARAQSVEPEAAPQLARKVTVRPRRRESRGREEAAETPAAAAAAEPLYLAASRRGHSRGGPRQQSGLLFDTPQPPRRRREPSLSSEDSEAGSTPAAAIAFKASSLFREQQSRRHMSKTEAYFGRVPGVSADFQRLLGSRRKETPPRSFALSSEAAAASINGHESLRAFSSKQQATHSWGDGGFVQKGASNAAEKDADRQKQLDGKQAPPKSGKTAGQKEAKTRSSSKLRRARSSPLDQTEAATAVRALAAAQASAEAAAAARAATAGPMPAWRRQQQEASHTAPQPLQTRQQSALRKSLSFPISMFAKVKAKFSRSKSNNLTAINA
ncbi:hypothetical protein Efla_001686 [Eimeria flavescens]